MKVEIRDDLLTKLSLCGAEISEIRELRNGWEYWSCHDGSVLGEKNGFWNGYILIEDHGC